MCNGGPSARTAQGGTIAILRPIRPSLHRELALRLMAGEAGHTRAIISGLEEEAEEEADEYEEEEGEEDEDEEEEAAEDEAEPRPGPVRGRPAGPSTARDASWSRHALTLVISRDGDLTCAPRLRDGDGSVLHRFSVPRRGRDFLAPAMDLGAGGDGIIGRRVSLVRNRVLVGQGVIGWN